MIFLSAQNPTIINLPSSSITCFLPFGWGKLPWTKSAVFFNIVETVGGRKSNPYKKCCTFKGLNWANIILIHKSFYRRKNCQKKTDSSALFISSPFWFKWTIVRPFWRMLECWHRCRYFWMSNWLIILNKKSSFQGTLFRLLIYSFLHIRSVSCNVN